MRAPSELALCVDNRQASLFFVCALIRYPDSLSVRLSIDMEQPFFALPLANTLIYQELINSS